MDAPEERENNEMEIKFLMAQIIKLQKQILQMSKFIKDTRENITKMDKKIEKLSQQHDHFPDKSENKVVKFPRKP